MVEEQKRRFGLVLDVRCYHPDEHEAYKCEPIENEVDGREYQGFLCPKCKHEIGLVPTQYYFDDKDLEERKGEA